MMFLHLDFPDDWTLIDELHQTVALSPGSRPEQPEVLVAWGPLLGAMGDDAVLWNRMLEVSAGGARIEHDAPVARRTARGWPCTEVAARLFVGETLVEERLAVVYHLDEWRGTALVRALDSRRFTELAEVVRSALDGAQPDWRSDGEIVCIAHLYEGEA